MQQFVVPQFIDVEDKIFGPITTRQFVILLVAGVLVFAEYKASDFSLFLVEGILTLLFGGVLAFLKVNGMPIHIFLVNFAQTARRPALRIWKTVPEHLPKTAVGVVTVPAKPTGKPPVSRSRLTELALVVDTGGAYREEEQLSITN